MKPSAIENRQSVSKISSNGSSDPGYGLPQFEDLRPAALQPRVISRSDWARTKRTYVDIEQTREAFSAVVHERKKLLMEESKSAVDSAFQEGMTRATEALLQLNIELRRSAEQQQDDLIGLMFAAIETILGTQADELVTAKLARVALNQQVDAQSVIAVTVHTDSLESVGAQIEAWRAETGAPRIELRTDTLMATTDCEIETVYGTVRAGLSGQLAVLRQNLRQANRATMHD